MRLKLKMEEKLKESKLNYTIFQCSGFLQGIISQYALPVLDNETVWVQKNAAPIAYLDTEDAASAVVETLKTTSYNKKTIPLIGEKFWTSTEILNLCERLSGKTPNISYIPQIAFNVLRRFFRFFEFSWNIADRLKFGEVSSQNNMKTTSQEEFIWSKERLPLESYLQSYFGRILKKLRETNYQESTKSKEISFL